VAGFKTSVYHGEMKRLLLAYLVVLHAALLVFAVRFNVVERIRLHLRAGDTPTWIASEWFIHQETDPLVPAGATIFLGDSIIRRMPASAVADKAVNYGVDGQSSSQLMASLSGYPSIAAANAVVLNIGATDFMQNRPIDYARVLDALPPVPVVLSSLTPIAGRDLTSVVTAARIACVARPKCIFVDAYHLLHGQDVLLPDGVHLSVNGYRLWVSALRSALAVARH
jgi:hypothetical protein